MIAAFDTVSHDILISKIAGSYIYLKENSLLISAPKSTVTLFTPDTHQFQSHQNILLQELQLCDRYDRQEKQYAKGTGGIILGQDKDTLLLTYNATGKSITSYAAVMSTNASDSSFKKIHTAQNAALRTTTGAHKMDRLTIFTRSPSR